jgi:hypothetical protein
MRDRSSIEYYIKSTRAKIDAVTLWRDEAALGKSAARALTYTMIIGRLEDTLHALERELRNLRDLEDNDK